MAKTSVWIHAVWGTKKRDRVLLSDQRAIICRHIIQNAQEKGFYVDMVDGYLDHLHCLMILKPGWTIAKQMQMIKGESAYWINKNKLLEQKLEWADGYFAASVSMGNWILREIISCTRKRIIVNVVLKRCMLNLLPVWNWMRAEAWNLSGSRSQ